MEANSRKDKAWRNDAVAKVTGHARYTDDLKAPGMLHAVPVYADAVHARIVDIDLRQALATPGVVRIVTAADVIGSATYGQIRRDYPMLAQGTVRYHGEVVALVVAESRAAACAARDRVRIRTEELPCVLDPEQAMKPGAPLVHPSLGSNIVNHHKVRRGDVDAGFAAADVVVEHTFRTQLIEHAYLEPESALCIPRPDGVMEVYGSMQHPFSTRRFVAAILGAALKDVEVKSVPMGGGFGGKDDTAACVCARAALCARLCNRPVKITYDRRWSMRESYKRHPYRIHYKMGVTRAGRITAVDVRCIADAGAYCSVTPWVTWRSAVQCAGPYRVDNVRCDVYGVYTHNVFTGAMRGFGSPQMIFCSEQMMEQAAAAIGWSGVAFRRANMLRNGDTTITGQVLSGHEVSLGQVIDALVDETDYEQKLARCTAGNGAGAGAQEGDELYGIGLALSYRGMSLGAEGVDANAAIVNVQLDGSILLEVGIHENGQGSESTMMTILSEELGVCLERIRYRQPSTSAVPDGGSTVASRGTLMGGGAVVMAARGLKDKIARVLSERLGWSAEDIQFRDDQVLDGKSGQAVSFDEAIGHLHLAQEFPFALGTFRAPPVSWDEERGQGNAYFTWVYGGQVVELTVHRRTGRVTLLNATAAHDVGRAINPPLLRGQLYGGMAMGIGFALHEEVTTEEGRITSLNFDRYRIPRANHLPEMKAIVIENPDPSSPSGAKGVGEPTNELMAAAIANAVFHATGQQPCELPIRVRPLP